MLSLIRSSVTRSAPRAFTNVSNRFMSSAHKPPVISSESSSFGWESIGKMTIPVITFIGVVYVTSPPDNFKPRLTVAGIYIYININFSDRIIIFTETLISICRSWQAELGKGPR